MYILGIDPGVSLHGWAILLFSGSDAGATATYVAGGHSDSPNLEVDSMVVFESAVERPCYQGPTRTVGTILDTAYSAGWFACRFGAAPYTPIEWKKVLFGKGSGVTSAQVIEYVDRHVRRLPKLRASEKAHVYDACCLAICHHSRLVGLDNGLLVPKVKAVKKGTSSK
jgi:Holliday junction resolvasome RuvABC endonuclease subunit